jgi:hypothetical protein
LPFLTTSAPNWTIYTREGLKQFAKVNGKPDFFELQGLEVLDISDISEVTRTWTLDVLGAAYSGAVYLITVRVTDPLAVDAVPELRQVRVSFGLHATYSDYVYNNNRSYFKSLTEDIKWLYFHSAAWCDAMLLRAKRGLDLLETGSLPGYGINIGSEMSKRARISKDQMRPMKPADTSAASIVRRNELTERMAALKLLLPV